MPRVSIVLPVYNVAPYIGDTIDSLLKQTFADFELLVFDDCSTDDTAARVEFIRDPRLRFVQNAYNLGRAGTDNAALPYVSAEFVAKMDGDDLCHPQRLARQVAYFDQHPEVNVVGSWMQNFGASAYLNRYPTAPAASQVRTLFTLPVGNPSVMLRTRLLREEGMHYDATLRQTEDYDFFARYVRELRVATLPETLIKYRVPPDAIKNDVLIERTAIADGVRQRLLQTWGLDCTARELEVHNTIAMLDRSLGDVQLEEVEAWLYKLLTYNDGHKLFESAALRQGVAERWFEVCYTHPQPRLDSMRQFERSSLSAYHSLGAQQWLKFLARGIRKF
ncbi:MAG: glycosyltransferase family 2 protein [Janthinobacterium lividum]